MHAAAETQVLWKDLCFRELGISSCCLSSPCGSQCASCVSRPAGPTSALAVPSALTLSQQPKLNWKNEFVTRLYARVLQRRATQQEREAAEQRMHEINRWMQGNRPRCECLPFCLPLQA